MRAAACGRKEQPRRRENAVALAAMEKVVQPPATLRFFPTSKPARVAFCKRYGLRNEYFQEMLNAETRMAGGAITRDGSVSIE